MPAALLPASLPTIARARALAGDVIEGRLDPEAALDEAIRRADGDGAVSAAIAAALAKKPIDAAHVARALVLVTDEDAFVAITTSAAGDRVKALCDAASTQRMTIDQDALALFVAHTLAGGAEESKRVITLARSLSRYELSDEAATLVGLVALASKDEHLRAVAKPWLHFASDDVGQRTAARLRESIARPLEASLPERVERVIAAGETVRRAAKVGRNDPCPCGSGKKFKKCHEGKEAELEALVAAARGAANESANESANEKRSAKVEDPKDVIKLGLREIVAMDLDPLGEPMLMAVMHRACDLGRWDVAERAMDAVAARLKDDAKAIDLRRDELVSRALAAKEVALAKANLAKIVDRANILPANLIGLDLLEPSADTAAHLEDEARFALEDASGIEAVELALALLDHSPALGVLVARAAVTPSRAKDSRTLLDEIEMARDRLGLPPGDPALTMYEALAGVLDKVKGEEKTRRKLDQVREQARDKAKDLRQRAKDAAKRASELERRLKMTAEELASLAAVAKPVEEAKPASVAVYDEEERRRLRTKVAELTSLIAEGNEERAELRRALAEANERAEKAAPVVAAPDGDAEIDEQDDAEEGFTPLAPAVRGVVPPRFSKSGEAALRDVPARIGRDALRVIAQLSAGDAQTWHEVKQLERVSTPLFSARVGIHYRLLFRAASDDLEVVELFHRKDLKAIIKRYA